MSDCKFTIPFSADPATILNKAKSAIESQNGIFNGNTNDGNFEVTVFSNYIKGSYAISGQEINIIITNKPFFVPCNAIEGFLRSKLS